MINYKLEAVQWLASEHKKLRSKKPHQKGFIGSRAYVHFDAPINLFNPTAIGRLAYELGSAASLTKWQFFPFITNYERMRRYRHEPPGTPAIHRDQTKGTHLKSRPIMMAGHRDACLLSFLSFCLTNPYETVLAEHGLEKTVVAYRALEGKNNVDHAKRAFDYMSTHDGYTCILIDIKGFFDNIQHRHLEAAVCEVLGIQTLPPELQHIFTNLTEYRHVNDDKAIKALKAAKKKYHIPIPSTNTKRFCKLEDYNELIDSPKFISKNTKGIGIPQGSPVSGILANISLLGFDRWLQGKVNQLPFGMYQRYSDDIVLIVPATEASKLYRELVAQLGSYGLIVSAKKTEAFIREEGQLRNVTSLFESRASNKRRAVQYLGLEWDGEQIVLRPATVNKRFRPKRKLDKKFWLYNKRTIVKIAQKKPMRRQFQRLRRTIKQRESNTSDILPKSKS